MLAITYLASNTVGSVVPSPGGLGPVELALTGGLVTAGVPSGVAVSAVLVYRLVTFWIPIPLGYLSLQRLQSVGISRLAAFFDSAPGVPRRRRLR